MSKKLGQIHKNEKYIRNIMREYKNKPLTEEVVKEVIHILDKKELYAAAYDLYPELKDLFIYQVAKGLLKKYEMIKIANVFENTLPYN